MTLILDAVPDLDGPLRLANGSPRAVSRRQILAGSLAVGSAMALRVFQRPAFAHTATPTDYNIGPDCGGANYPDCGGCLTTNRIIGGCCGGFEQEIHCPHGAGYHIHDHSSGYDLRPNLCPPTAGANYSGWYWLWAGCCPISSGVCRKNRKWRCHDGYINGKASICRWVVSSGTSCTPCPQ